MFAKIEDCSREKEEESAEDYNNEQKQKKEKEFEERENSNHTRICRIIAPPPYENNEFLEGENQKKH